MYEYEISIIMGISLYILYALFNRHEMSEKRNFVITGTFLVIAVITFLSNIQTIQNNLNEMFGEFGMISFGIIVILVIFFMLASISFITKSIDYIIHKQAKQTITAKLSKKSKTCLDGYLIFNVKFTGWLFAGYFVINIKSPYWEEKSIHIRYDDIKKQGQLKGKYNDKCIQLRCTIPSNWGFGEYDVTIRVEDVCKWRFSLKKIMNLSSHKLKVMIK